MKIDNSIITSLDCLKRHFNFRELFGKIDIFVRDLSPENIPYGDRGAELLYKIIASPQGVKVAEGTFICDSGESYLLKHNEVEIFDSPTLSGYTMQDKIRIVALYELVGIPVEPSQVEMQVVDALAEGDILLSRGQSIAFAAGNHSELVCRLIRVADTAVEGCRVGDITLQAGGMAYGLFSNAGLCKVLKSHCSNSSYRLRLTEWGDRIVLRVTDIAQGQEMTMAGVCSFCTIGDDNYLYIANNQVYSHHDYKLGQRLRTCVGLLDTPIAVEVVGDEVVVTMQEGTVRKFNYKDNI